MDDTLSPLRKKESSETTDLTNDVNNFGDIPSILEGCSLAITVQVLRKVEACLVDQQKLNLLAGEPGVWNCIPPNVVQRLGAASIAQNIDQRFCYLFNRVGFVDWLHYLLGRQIESITFLCCEAVRVCALLRLDFEKSEHLRLKYLEVQESHDGIARFIYC